VLLISPWIRLGGSESVVLRLARLLRDAGWDADVACCFVDRSFIETETDGVHFIRPWRWIGWLAKRNRVVMALLGCPALLVLVLARAKRYTLLNPHNFPALQIAAFTSQLFRIPVVWHFNEPAPVDPVLQRLERTAARRPAAITVLDERSRTQVRRMMARDARIIRAGVDFAFWSQPGGEPSRAALGLEDALILLTVGKIHPQKNQLMLVDVLALLRDELPQLALVITGEGPDRARVEARARALGMQARVRFTGVVDATTLRSLYACAFLTCFPALQQTWGLTPFEALCQRRVSLVSSQTGAAEVLQAQRIGLVAEPDPHAFAGQIRAAQRQPETIDAMAVRGLAFVRTLSWQRFGDEMREVFEAAA